VRFTIRRFAYFSSSHNTQISNLAPSFCSQPCTHKLSHNQTLTRTILCLTHLCVLQKKYTYHPQTTCKIHQLSHITFCISVYSLSLVCFKNSKSISKWCTNTYINQIKECNENTIFKYIFHYSLNTAQNIGTPTKSIQKKWTNMSIVRLKTQLRTKWYSYYI